MSPKSTISVSQNDTPVNTEQLAARLERLAPSMRDGKSIGRMEKAARWLSGRLVIEYSDALDDMINFLWSRPDLLGSGNTDAWLVQRAVYFIRGQACDKARRGRVWVSLDEIGETLTVETPDNTGVMPASLTGEAAKLAAEILENADQVFCASSGRVNVSRLARRMGLGRNTVRVRLQEIGARLREFMPERMVAA